MRRDECLLQSPYLAHPQPLKTQQWNGVTHPIFNVQFTPSLLGNILGSEAEVAKSIEIISKDCQGNLNNKGAGSLTYPAGFGFTSYKGTGMR